MAISPFQSTTPVSEVPKEFAILCFGEEKRTSISRRERRANLRKQK